MAEKEYIERDGVMQKFADRVWMSNHSDFSTTPTWNQAVQIVEDFPAAAVRPVVLCRDCKWTNTDEVEDPAIYCWKWDRWEMPPDGFCWLGKKREES